MPDVHSTDLKNAELHGHSASTASRIHIYVTFRTRELNPSQSPLKVAICKLNSVRCPWHSKNFDCFLMLRRARRMGQACSYPSLTLALLSGCISAHCAIVVASCSSLDRHEHVALSLLKAFRRRDMVAHARPPLNYCVSSIR